MNYDDLVLECKGDCDDCEVFLECQYQTSSGEEKQKYLDMLNARDKKPSAEETAEEVTATEAEEVTETEEVTEAEEAAEEPVDTEAEESAEEPVDTEAEESTEEPADTEAEESANTDLQEVANETVETVTPCEAPEDVNEACAETETTEEVFEETITDSVLSNESNAPAEKITPPSKEEVDAIFNEVFNLAVCDEACETCAETETVLEAAEEVSETIDDTVTEANEEPSTENQEVAVFESQEDIASETSLSTQEDTIVCDEENVSLPSDETVAEIFDEVFKLSNQPATEIVNVQTKTTDIEKITPPSREEVDAIFNEVFKLTAIKEEEVSCVEAQTPTLQEATETAENTEPTEVQPETETAADLQEVASVTETESEEPKPESVLEENVSAEVAVEQPETQTSVESAAEVATNITETASEPALEAPVKEVFKLVPPENNEELLAAMCAKRARKLIYKPSEAIITVTYKVLGTDKKNDIGEKVKDILDAEIKQGVKLGYLDKFDGLSSAEIKEEYENDIVYEFAEQEFKKTGVILDGKKVKVYIYDWDGKACHNVGYVNADEAAELIPYLQDKESYSFDVCGIITGGKGKRVVKEGNTLKIIKEKGDPIGLDVDIAVLKRKD